MQLIVGLGNWGKEYRFNRHNTGFMVLDFLSTKFSVEQSVFGYQKKFDSEVFKLENVILAKPQTFMNSSGVVVKKLVDFYKVITSNLWVVHDDLDIKLGQYKIQKGVGPKLHNGVESVEKLLGKNDFWRVRVGVDNRDAKNRVSGEEYVLRNFTNEEKDILKRVANSICDELMNSLDITEVKHGQ